MKPILFYDESCPICRGVKSHIEGKVGDRIEYRDAGPKAKEYKYVNSKNDILVGYEAIKGAISDFPELGSVVGFLPEKMRPLVLAGGAHVASVIRNANKILEVVRGKSKDGDCGCGGNKQA